MIPKSGNRFSGQIMLKQKRSMTSSAKKKAARRRPSLCLFG